MPNFKIDLKFRRERDPRVLLRSAEGTLWINSSVFVLFFPAQMAIVSDESRAITAVMSTVFAVFAFAAGLRVLLLRRRIRRSALLQARFDSAI
jgi:hypothetical protein